MTIAIAALHVALATAAAKPPAPLATAFVINGELLLADVPTRSLRPIHLDGLRADEADLSTDKTRIVVDARPKEGGLLKLYLVDVGTGIARSLGVPLRGDQRFPRFTAGGEAILFSASHLPQKDGPANRTRIERLDLVSGRVEELATNPDHCEFSTMQMGDGRVAHVSTSCYINFAVDLLAPRTRADSLVARVSDSRSEIAVSTDGKKLVYTSRGVDGLDFFLLGPGATVRKLAAVPAMSQRIQPRFVCPRNLLFLNGTKIESLDSESGALTEIMTVQEGLAAGRAPGSAAGSAKQ